MVLAQNLTITLLGIAKEFWMNASKTVVTVSPVMVINAGHDLALHRNAPALFATVIEWSNRVFKY